jgi:ankyrin repeat protein
MGKKEVVVARELTIDEKWVRAACAGDHAQITEILKGNPEQINKQDALGVTALMCAANNGHAEVVKQLLQKGADPTIKGQTNNTALDLALKCNQPQVILLLQQYSVSGNLAGSA